MLSKDDLLQFLRPVLPLAFCFTQRAPGAADNLARVAADTLRLPLLDVNRVEVPPRVVQRFRPNGHVKGRPTFHRAEKYGRLIVSGNVVGLKPVDDDSGWWIEISPKVIAKLRQNKEARPLTYLGRTVTPDFDFGIGRGPSLLH